MKAVDVLYRHNLKRTSCREGIIELILSSGQALSENEIREKLAANYDRTTFYRSFKKLEESKILHKIVIDNTMVKYALDNSITNKKEHAHFYCNDCHTVKCLETVPVQEIKLPEGYIESETEVLIKGVCPFCKNKKD
jgi:Fur family transcriptional regulator, ferric uptake regulator